jgi:hypothetical protein
MDRQKSLQRERGGNREHNRARGVPVHLDVLLSAYVNFDVFHSQELLRVMEVL